MPVDLLQVAGATTIVVLPVDGTIFNPTRGFQGDMAGTATVTDSAGNVISNYPITGLEQNISITAVDDLVTTTAVWGLY